MQDDPFSSILGTFRRDNDSHKSDTWLIGTVISAAPIVIKAAGLELTGEDLLVNIQLAAHEEAMTLSALSGNISGAPSVTVNGGKIAASGFMGGILQSGDMVVLLPSEDRQQFVMLCKVVQVI